MFGKLSLIHPDGRSTKEFLISQQFTYFGKDKDCDIRFEFDKCAGKQFLLTAVRDVPVKIQNLVKKNGTLVNQKWIGYHIDHDLKDGDVISIGPRNLMWNSNASRSSSKSTSGELRKGLEKRTRNSEPVRQVAVVTPNKRDLNIAEAPPAKRRKTTYGSAPYTPHKCSSDVLLHPEPSSLARRMNYDMMRRKKMLTPASRGKLRASTAATPRSLISNMKTPGSSSAQGKKKITFSHPLESPNLSFNREAGLNKSFTPRRFYSAGISSAPFTFRGFNSVSEEPDGVLDVNRSMQSLMGDDSQGRRSGRGSSHFSNDNIKPSFHGRSNSRSRATTGSFFQVEDRRMEAPERSINYRNSRSFMAPLEESQYSHDSTPQSYFSPTLSGTPRMMRAESPSISQNDQAGTSGSSFRGRRSLISSTHSTSFTTPQGLFYQMQERDDSMYVNTSRSSQIRLRSSDDTAHNHYSWHDMVSQSSHSQSYTNTPLPLLTPRGSRGPIETPGSPSFSPMSCSDSDYIILPPRGRNLSASRQFERNGGPSSSFSRSPYSPSQSTYDFTPSPTRNRAARFGKTPKRSLSMQVLTKSLRKKTILKKKSCSDSESNATENGSKTLRKSFQMKNGTLSNSRRGRKSKTDSIGENNSENSTSTGSSPSPRVTPKAKGKSPGLGRSNSEIIVSPAQVARRSRSSKNMDGEDMCQLRTSTSLSPVRSSRRSLSSPSLTPLQKRRSSKSNVVSPLSGNLDGKLNSSVGAKGKSRSTIESETAHSVVSPKPCKGSLVGTPVTPSSGRKSKKVSVMELSSSMKCDVQDAAQPRTYSSPVSSSKRSQIAPSLTPVLQRRSRKSDVHIAGSPSAGNSGGCKRSTGVRELRASQSTRISKGSLVGTPTAPSSGRKSKKDSVVEMSSSMNSDAQDVVLPRTSTSVSPVRSSRRSLSTPSLTPVQQRRSRKSDVHNTDSPSAGNSGGARRSTSVRELRISQSTPPSRGSLVGTPVAPSSDDKSKKDSVVEMSLNMNNDTHDVALTGTSANMSPVRSSRRSQSAPTLTPMQQSRSRRSNVHNADSPEAGHSGGAKRSELKTSQSTSSRGSLRGTPVTPSSGRKSKKDSGVAMSSSMNNDLHDSAIPGTSPSMSPVRSSSRSQSAPTQTPVQQSRFRRSDIHNADSPAAGNSGGAEQSASRRSLRGAPVAPLSGRKSKKDSVVERSLEKSRKSQQSAAPKSQNVVAPSSSPPSQINRSSTITPGKLDLDNTITHPLPLSSRSSRKSGELLQSKETPSKNSRKSKDIGLLETSASLSPGGPSRRSQSDPSLMSLQQRESKKSNVCQVDSPLGDGKLSSSIGKSRKSLSTVEQESHHSLISARLSRASSRGIPVVPIVYPETTYSVTSTTRQSTDTIRDSRCILSDESASSLEPSMTLDNISAIPSSSKRNRSLFSTPATFVKRKDVHVTSTPFPKAGGKIGSHFLSESILPIEVETNNLQVSYLCSDSPDYDRITDEESFDISNLPPNQRTSNRITRLNRTSDMTRMTPKSSIKRGVFFAVKSGGKDMKSRTSPANPVNVNDEEASPNSETPTNTTLEVNLRSSRKMSSKKRDSPSTPLTAGKASKMKSARLVKSLSDGGLEDRSSSSKNESVVSPLATSLPNLRSSRGLSSSANVIIASGSSRRSASDLNRSSLLQISSASNKPTISPTKKQTEILSSPSKEVIAERLSLSLKKRVASLLSSSSQTSGSSQIAGAGSPATMMSPGQRSPDRRTSRRQTSGESSPGVPEILVMAPTPPSTSRTPPNTKSPKVSLRSSRKSSLSKEVSLLSPTTPTSALRRVPRRAVKRASPAARCLKAKLDSVFPRGNSVKKLKIDPDKPDKKKMAALLVCHKKKSPSKDANTSTKTSSENSRRSLDLDSAAAETSPMRAANSPSRSFKYQSFSMDADDERSRIPPSPLKDLDVPPQRSTPEDDLLNALDLSRKSDVIVKPKKPSRRLRSSRKKNNLPGLSTQNVVEDFPASLTKSVKKLLFRSPLVDYEGSKKQAEPNANVSNVKSILMPSPTTSSEEPMSRVFTTSPVVDYTDSNGKKKLFRASPTSKGGGIKELIPAEEIDLTGVKNLFEGTPSPKTSNTTRKRALRVVQDDGVSPPKTSRTRGGAKQKLKSTPPKSGAVKRKNVTESETTGKSSGKSKKVALETSFETPPQTTKTVSKVRQKTRQTAPKDMKKPRLSISAVRTGLKPKVVGAKSIAKSERPRGAKSGNAVTKGTVKKTSNRTSAEKSPTRVASPKKSPIKTRGVKKEKNPTKTKQASKAAKTKNSPVKVASPKKSPTKGASPKRSPVKTRKGAAVQQGKASPAKKTGVKKAKAIYKVKSPAKNIVTSPKPRIKVASPKARLSKSPKSRSRAQIASPAKSPVKTRRGAATKIQGKTLTKRTSSKSPTKVPSPKKSPKKTASSKKSPTKTVSPKKSPVKTRRGAAASKKEKSPVKKQVSTKAAKSKSPQKTPAKGKKSAAVVNKKSPVKKSAAKKVGPSKSSKTASPAKSTKSKKVQATKSTPKKQATSKASPKKLAPPKKGTAIAMSQLKKAAAAKKTTAAKSTQKRR